MNKAITTIVDWVQQILGVGVELEGVNSLQMAARTLVVYVFTLAIVRLGSRRFMGKGSAFDIIVGIMLGSVMSRAINGTAPFIPTLFAGVMLVALHWLLGYAALHTTWLGPLIKGHPILLIRDGTVLQDGLERANLTALDLTEALRLNGQVDPRMVRVAYLERDGSVSVIPFHHTQSQ